MSRRDDGCFSIIGIIVFILFSLVSAFKGQFIPIIIVIILITILWFASIIEKRKNIRIENKTQTQNYNNEGDNNSKFGLIIFIIFIGVFISLILKGQKNEYLEEKETQFGNYDKYQRNENTIVVEDTIIVKEKLVEELVWHTERFNNCEFEVPSNLKLNDTISKNNSKIYIDYNLNISISLNYNTLNENNLNRTIDDFSENLYEYASAINENNKLNFDDFKLIDYGMSEIGTSKAIKIEQSSRKLSGIKNIELKVISYSLISKPYYYDITFSYPNDSIKYDTLFNRINKSFIFID